MRYENTRSWRLLIIYAAIVGLAANYVYYNFPFNEAPIIYEQY